MSTTTNRIYFDNAATSWPKPPGVYQAVQSAMVEVGAAAGRGSYSSSRAASLTVEQARSRIAQLIHARHSDSVVFTFNGTDALSTGIFGTVDRGDHVVTSVLEHSSVLRPLMELERTGMISLTVVDCNDEGRLDPDSVINAIKPNTRLVSLIHASNVTGIVQPLKEIGSRIAALHRDRLRFLVDAAQSIGCIELDVQQLGCDLLCAPGHKCLLGPLGTGVLYMSERSAQEMKPLRFGGTGSGDEFHPSRLPEKFEAGNLNVPGIAGLLAGLEFLGSTEGHQAKDQRQRLSESLMASLRDIQGISLVADSDQVERIGVFAFNVEGYDAREVAAILDSTWNIECRAGLHCAPLLHRRFGTEIIGGAVRLSTGLFQTEEQVESVRSALRQLVAG